MSRAWEVADFIPTGGAPGETLTKATAADYDTAWATPAGGGLPPIVPGADQGKALAINASDTPEWGAEIKPVFPAEQTIDAGIIGVDIP